MNETVITLPFPVSVNGAFKKFKGKNLSEPYRKWRDAAGMELMIQRPRKHRGRVEIEMKLVNPNEVERDIDNHFKGVLDLLKTHGVIEADNFRFVRKVTGEWVDEGAPCTVTVRPY